MRIDAALVALAMAPRSNGKVVAPARRKLRKMSAAGRKEDCSGLAEAVGQAEGYGCQQIGLEFFIEHA